MSAQQVEFGERLRAFRLSAGFSQEVLAELAGLSANAISALERGERKRPYPDTIRRLAKALGLSEGDRAALVASASGTHGVTTFESNLGDATGTHSGRELPGEPTPLIGREHEVDVVRHLLEHSGSRLLTLTGPGGVGKTRLALNVARTMASQFPDGVFWVDLAPVSDPEFALATIARSLGIEETLGVDTSESLRSYLGRRRSLLVLDNLEHLLDAASDIAGLLHSSSRVVILVTSRARLNIRGEQEYVVPPLELPPAREEAESEDVARNPSVQLFLWHVRLKDPAFALTDRNALHVTRICRRLDGVPLALELAAPKARALGMAGLLDRLERALPVLTDGPRDLPARQRTMEAAIQWSYDLLGSGEQALFRRLAVFSGGWTLEAAETVVNVSDPHVGDVFGSMMALVDQSLVRRIGHDDSDPRFAMLETLREFGVRRLSEVRERDAVQLAHLRWCISLAETAEKGLGGREQAFWLGRLEAEHDNIRTALGSTLEGSVEERLRLAGALWRFWWWHGHFTEGRAWLAQILSEGGELMSVWRGKALTAAGILAREQGDFGHARAELEESLAIRRALGDRRGTAQTLNILGLIANTQDDITLAIERFEAGLALYRDEEDQLGVANILNNLGTALRDHGQFERAAALYRESVDIYRSHGEKRGLAVALHNLGRVTRDLGDRPRAMEYFEECLAIEHELGDRLNIAMTLHNMGRVAQDDGDLARAAGLFEDSLDIRVEFGDKLGSVKVIEDVAAVAATLGNAEVAVRYYSAAAAMRDALGAPIPQADRDHHEQCFSQAGNDLDPASRAEIVAGGRKMSVDAAVDEALIFLRQVHGNLPR